jgi:hypothetical protein
MELVLPEGSFTDWPTRGGVQTLPQEERAALRRKVVLTDGGVYDNHALEPVAKRYMTLLVSDGGAPFGRSAEIGFDWVRQLKRIVAVTDNQVRALRRRGLIETLSAGKAAFDAGTLKDNATRQFERLGAYWGIDSDADKVAPPDALPCDGSLTDRLARTSTRLARLDETVSKQLVNWGYATRSRRRSNYRCRAALSPMPLLTKALVGPGHILFAASMAGVAVITPEAFEVISDPSAVSEVAGAYEEWLPMQAWIAAHVGTADNGPGWAARLIAALEARPKIYPRKLHL